ncbi:MAG: Mut7-C RNAse domain-containing protein, partial [Planctomycetota bacterium]
MTKTNERGSKASFRFFAELNDFLPAHDRGATLEYAFSGRPSVKDAIEAQGVPHTEVNPTVVGGESVDFDYHLEDEDFISVYPMFESIDIAPVVKLRENPLRKPRFILDVHLGKLARRMRLLGFDVLYRNDYHDPEIVRLSVEKRRA